MFGLSLAWVVAAVAVGVLAGQFAFRKDTQREERRKSALAVSRVLSGKGLVTVPLVLEMYAVGDYSGMLHHLREAAITLNNPAAAAAEFDAIFEKMLVAKLANGEVKAELVKRITGGDSPVEVSAKTAAKSAA